ncbi:germination protein YpeB [Paenibacillus thermoaerophilus]|uniref:Germination protein YpeB n=1 Tax=Paenibacillus thermoaerophilus TaxID=1215385 RepID=A0ABW2V807_9BACL|nr:germination protein YpeB [Paenibacillus thermoaerophilus]
MELYRRLSSVLFPVVTIALVGTALWGYQVNQEKNTILIKAENQYQRAFHDLSYSMDKLHSELGNALAVHSKSHLFHKRCLMNVWRMTSQAQSDVNQLPLSLIPFQHAEQFLSNLSKFSYRNAVRDLGKQPLSDQELKTLEELYNRSGEIVQQLRTVQTNVLDQNLRWMDVEVAMATQSNSYDPSINNMIVAGFQDVNSKIGEYAEVDWGPSLDKKFQMRSLALIEGPEATEQQVREKAAAFLGLPDGSQLQVSENGAGTEFATYSVAYRPNESQSASMDFTKRGGKLIWFMNSRAVSEKNLEPDQATEVAQQFLKDQGYESLTAVTYDEFNNVAHMTFATSQDGYVIYPEKVVIGVALDNGEITSLQAGDYILEKKPRELGKPQMSEEEARSRLNPELRIESTGLAVVRNELDQDVRCREFTGTIRGMKMKVFLNADTGIEEKVETLNQQA